MLTEKEYRQQAQDCLKLAKQANCWSNNCMRAFSQSFALSRPCEILLNFVSAGPIIAQLRKLDLA
jgi:hypothetical protein